MEEINIDTYDIQPTIIENEETYEEPINKIYARPNESGVVIHIFSEAFEQPQPNDVCINDTNTERHFAQTYKVFDDNGFYNYLIKNGKMVERDKSTDMQALKDEQRKAEIKARLGQLSEDIVQDMVGEKVPNIADRKVEFYRLHNELRKLEGKAPRDIK